MAVRGPIPFGGLNTKTNTSAFSGTVVGNWMDIPLGQMSTCNDFNLLYGALTGRPNMAQFSAAIGSDRVWGLKAWVDAANYSQGNTIFAIGSDAKLYSSPWVYGQVTPATMTNVTGTATLDTTSQWQFGVLNNILCGFGSSAGTGVPFQVTAFNGTASNLAGSPPKGDVVKVVNNFMFVGRQLNSSSTFSRVSWSNVGDPQTWTATNFVDFRKNDGDRITALGAIGTDLYIFKFNSIGRLSTTTQIISGSATLGPLDSLFTGIGAYGPFCVDNLPDGRIVFLGSDLRLYIFDGFTLQNISDPPAPQPNVQPSIEQMPTFNATNLFIKVYPTHNQIFVGQGTGGTGTHLLAYDYQQNFWSQWTSVFPVIMETVPSFDFVVGAGGFFYLPYSLIYGNYQGKIFQADNNSTFYGAANESIQALVQTCTINVPLTGDYYEFLPRCLLLPIGNGATTVAGVTNGLTVTFGWDGTFSSSASFTMQSATTYPNTLIINIPQAKESGTTLRPTSLQIKLQTTPGPTIHPFYLSDEVMN